MRNLTYICILFFVQAILSCSDSKNVDDDSIIQDSTKSIIWDDNSLVQISEPDGDYYNGYARLIQLEDKSLICTYESGGSIVIKKSNDLGATWGTLINVVSGDDEVNMATPDILRLGENSILICYNPRPKPGSDASIKFAIRVVKSYDNGTSWVDDNLVYEASSKSDNGCWEPSGIQLPDGEIQLFFSNENIYQSSSEQNISLMRSKDSGITWSTNPQVVSFRNGSRDGMPSPILLKDQNEIVFSIEDNGVKNQFKPYIIKNSIAENWKSTVMGNDINRSHALADVIDNSIYAGAPYLAQLSNGQVLMSYQSTEGRTSNNINNAIMQVVLDTNQSLSFKGRTTPFRFSNGKSALWNSISVLEDDTIVALTTTNQFSSSNASQVWMIKGHSNP